MDALRLIAAIFGIQITRHPQDQTVRENDTVRFIAGARGRPCLRVSWEVNRNDGAGFTPIAQQREKLLTVPHQLAVDGYQFHAMFTTWWGLVRALTEDALLTVQSAPLAPLSVTQHPTNQTVTAGQPVSFRACATGNPAPTVQWQVMVPGASFIDLPGATDATFTLTAAVGQSGNQYRAVFANAHGRVETIAASLTVINTRRAIRLGQLQPLTVTVGSSVMLTVQVTRQNYDGPLEITIENLPPTLTAPRSTIQTGQTATQIQLTAAADTMLGVLDRQLTVRGDGVDDSATLRVIVARLVDVRFRRFCADPLHRFLVKLRRWRAAQLRTILAVPANVDLPLFNKEVWPLYKSALLDCKENVKSILAFDNRDLQFTRLRSRLSEFEQALENGRLKVHGNSIWGQGAGEYGTALRCSDQQKTDYIREALQHLNDEKLSPLQKAREIKKIDGFGWNNATGLVMVYHPEKFAIFNVPSRDGMNKFGHVFTERDNDLAPFEDAVSQLRDELKKCDQHEEIDFFQLDWFLFLVSKGVY